MVRCLWYGMVWYGMVWYGKMSMVWYGKKNEKQQLPLIQHNDITKRVLHMFKPGHVCNKPLEG